MAIVFQCDCGKRYSVDERLAGRVTRCSACNRELVIPSQTPDAAAGDFVPVNVTPEPRRPPGPNRSGESAPLSGYATASLVLGVASFCFAPLTGIPAIILGILGLRSIERSRGGLRGHPLAISGLILGGIGVLLTPVMFFFLLPAVQAARTAARSNTSMMQMRQLVLAANVYKDAKGEWPDHFADLAPYCEGKQGLARLLKNPLTGDDPGYEYVKPASDQNLSGAVIIFQLRDGRRDTDLPVAYGDVRTGPYRSSGLVKRPELPRVAKREQPKPNNRPESPKLVPAKKPPTQLQPLPQPLPASVVKTEVAGGLRADEFTDVAPDGSYLVGFHVTTRSAFGVDCIASVQPIYRDAGGADSKGNRHGIANENPRTVVARPGYAVGAVNAKAGLVLNGFEVIFMQKQGDAFDPSDTYTSEWLGDESGGGYKLLQSNGRPLVGIFGGVNNELVQGMGLIQSAEGKQGA